MSFFLKRAASGSLGVVSIGLFFLTPLGATNTSVARQGMPITFEQNQGQAHSGVRFVSRGASGVLYLSPDEITLMAPGKADRFRLKLHGAMPAVSLQGTGESSGTVNYFRGQEASNWLTNIPSYTQVTYKSVYPKIDLVVYGNNRQFESDFVVGSDADPSAISFAIDGKVEVGQDGSLLAKSGAGAFQLHRPFVYQIASSGERLPVDCRYTIGKGNNIGFALGQYDHSKSLVIDPVLSYSTYLGGTASDQIFGITGDVQGNIYVTGETFSTNFPTVKPEQATNAGGGDCFVAKFDPTGQHLLYSTYIGGTLEDRCVTIAVNLVGEAFVGGSTVSTNFPTYKPFQKKQVTTTNGYGGTVTSNGFIVHLDCTGSKLIFSTYFGGGGEGLAGIALDPLSNVYVTGITSSTKFPVTKGAFQTACASTCGTGTSRVINSFISKFSPDGQHLIYSTYLGGSNADSATGIAVDFTGSAYVSGEAHSLDFPTKNAYQAHLKGPLANAFATKLSPDGSSLIYSTYIGGTTFDSARSIAVDLFGNAYLAGVTQSADFPTVNAFQPQYNGLFPGYSSNMFVLKLNCAGSALVYSTYLGGKNNDVAFGVSVDLSGNASVVGETGSPNFPVKAAIQPTFGGGNLDVAVANFDTKGNLNFSTFLGGTSDEYGFAAYSDLCGSVWGAGATYSNNFPLASPYQGTFAGVFPTTADGMFFKIHP